MLCFSSIFLTFYLFYYRAQQAEEVEVVESETPSHTELSAIEKDCCKQNFIFYDKAKLGYFERFELPNVLSSK